MWAGKDGQEELRVRTKGEDAEEKKPGEQRPKRENWVLPVFRFPNGTATAPPCRTRQSSIELTRNFPDRGLCPATQLITQALTIDSRFKT